MKQLKFGCSRTEIFLSPDLEKLSKKEAMTKKWFVECVFYDPRFKNGLPVRKEFNRYKTYEERLEASKIMTKKIIKLLDEDHFNPITKKFMDAPDEEYNEEMDMISALKLAASHKTGSKNHVRNVRDCVKLMEGVFKKNGYDYLKISDVKLKHVKSALDQSDLTDNTYNKYRTYLSGLFKDLIVNSCLEVNPCTYLPTKIVVPEVRSTLSDDKFELVYCYLRDHYYEFFRYFNIFFMSGARTSELFRVQVKNIDLEKREYKTLVMKRRRYTWVTKVIVKDVLYLWEELVNESKSGEDYLFSKGLKPGIKSIRPDQITTRWRRHVKESEKIKDSKGRVVKITEDFYSLKHLFLDKVDEYYSELAQSMADHLNTKTTSTYTVSKEFRKREALKGISLKNIF